MKNNNKHSEKTKHTKLTPQQRAETKRFTSRILVGVSIALVIVFVIFIFVTTNFMGSDSVVTDTVYKTTVSDTISTTGFVIRDEEYIPITGNGVLAYQVSNGDKVTANGTIATIYNNETDAVNFQRICEIDEEITELKSLNNISNSVNVGLDSVNNQLDLKLESFIASVNERDFNDISTVENDLLSAVYRKQIITGDQKNFDANIAALESEKSELQQQTNNSIGEIVSKNSGYFSSSIDGYENAFYVEDLKDISYSDIEEVESEKVDESKYVGKIIKGVNWYLACPVTAEQAVAITHNSSNVSVRIPYASAELMPARVVSVNQFTGDEMAIVILECNYMSPSLAQIRNEAVDIQLNTYEGLKVSKEALHDDFVEYSDYDSSGNKITEEKKVQGVYVMYGRQLEFKQVFIIYSAEDYVICSENPGSSLISGSTVELYDEVVIEGDDLYDGKLID